MSVYDELQPVVWSEEEIRSTIVMILCRKGDTLGDTEVSQLVGVHPSRVAELRKALKESKDPRAVVTRTTEPSPTAEGMARTPDPMVGETIGIPYKSVRRSSSKIILTDVTNKNIHSNSQKVKTGVTKRASAKIKHDDKAKRSTCESEPNQTQKCTICYDEDTCPNIYLYHEIVQNVLEEHLPFITGSSTLCKCCAAYLRKFSLTCKAAKRNGGGRAEKTLAKVREGLSRWISGRLEKYKDRPKEKAPKETPSTSASRQSSRIAARSMEVHWSNSGKILKANRHKRVMSDVERKKKGIVRKEPKRIKNRRYSEMELEEENVLRNQDIDSNASATCQDSEIDVDMLEKSIDLDSEAIKEELETDPLAFCDQDLKSEMSIKTEPIEDDPLKI